MNCLSDDDTIDFARVRNFNFSTAIWVKFNVIIMLGTCNQITTMDREEMTYDLGFGFESIRKCLGVATNLELEKKTDNWRIAVF